MPTSLRWFCSQPCLEASWRGAWAGRDEAAEGQHGTLSFRKNLPTASGVWSVTARTPASAPAGSHSGRSRSCGQPALSGCWAPWSPEPGLCPVLAVPRVAQGGPGFFALQPLVSCDPHVYRTARRCSWSVLPPAAHHSPAWATHSQSLYSQACNSVPGDRWAPRGPQLTQRWKQHSRDEPGGSPPCLCRVSAPPRDWVRAVPLPS